MTTGPLKFCLSLVGRPVHAHTMHTWQSGAGSNLYSPAKPTRLISAKSDNNQRLSYCNLIISNMGSARYVGDNLTSHSYGERQNLPLRNFVLTDQLLPNLV